MASSPIAIVGIGCRFPGDLNNPQQFWDFLAKGGDALTEIPKERWNVESFWSQDPREPGKMASRRSGFISDIDKFDAQFFGISPREAVHLDPQQRILLEVSWEAFEDAGIIPQTLRGSRSGVFVGIFNNEYSVIQSRSKGSYDIHTAPGSALNNVPNRLSFVYDFRGPSIAVDTACSSSLVAVHLACTSLLTGECDLAVAAGTNVLLLPDSTVAFSKAGLLSRTGTSSPFDEQANGYVRAEGVGVVLLKPLAAALRDNDRVYAVISASGSNQDGDSGTFTTPSEEAQYELMRDVCRKAEVDPACITYIEAHGTGTPVGDPIEARAIGRNLGKRERPTYIGSLKANLGHMESSAGIAGLIKTALMVHHRSILPQINFQKPNPNIDFAGLGLCVPETLIHLSETTHPIHMGVNSFGFGGTNAHVLLSSPPENNVTAGPCPEHYLLPISTADKTSLSTQMRELKGFLKNEQHDLQDICYNAALRRTAHQCRVLLHGTSRTDILEMLERKLYEPELSDSIRSTSPVFVFTGQGSQWPGMGSSLLKINSVFRDVLERADRSLSRLTEWSLLAELTRPGSESRLSQTEVAQPAISAIQMGLFEVWRSWGVNPHAVIGHSVGEVAAAYAAGIYTLDQAIEVAYHRSRLQQRGHGHGAMAVISLPIREVDELIQSEFSGIEIAAINSNTLITICGSPADVSALLCRCERSEIFYRRLDVDYAFHSSQMDPIKDELLQSLESLCPSASSLRMVSTVRGDTIQGPEMDGSYWWDNVRRPVRLAAALGKVISEGSNIFIEVGPHAMLGGPILECLNDASVTGRAGASMKKDNECDEIYKGLALLFESGYAVDWSRFFQERRQVVALPTYRFRRDTFWKEAEHSKRERFRSTESTLLGSELSEGSGIWERELSTRHVPYLADHRLEQSVVLPATVYIELASAAARSRLGEHAVLESIRFENLCVLDDDSSVLIRVKLEDTGEITVCYSADSGGSWTKCASARAYNNPSEVLEPENLEMLIAAHDNEISAETFYDQFTADGYTFGPQFQRLKKILYNKNSALVELAHEELSGDFYCDPRLLDAAFQGIRALWKESNEGALKIPISMERFTITNPARPVWASITSRQIDGDFIFDISLRDSEGRQCAIVRGLALGSAAFFRKREHYYSKSWQKQPQVENLPQPLKSILIFWGGGIALRDLGTEAAKHGVNCVWVSPGSEFVWTSKNKFIIEPGNRSHIAQLVSALGSDFFEEASVLIAPEATEPSLSDVESLKQGTRYGSLTALAVIQELQGNAFSKYPRLFALTQGIWSKSNPGADLTEAPLWGLFRVVANEFPELKPVLIDLDAHDDQASKHVLNEMFSAADEREVAFYGGERFVNRLKELQPKDLPPRHYLRENDWALALSYSKAGSFDGLHWEHKSPERNGRHNLVIDVKACGLNFRDPLKVLGLYPGSAPDSSMLGDECSGIVKVLPNNESHFKTGDRVVAISPGCLASELSVDPRFVQKLPESATFAEAATFPIAFLTAWYALVETAKLRSGETVLIHASAGGVGQAALQIARLCGAQIFATAGSKEKRAWLREQGVQYVMDSRTLNFADEILAETAGRGVDVVLNSLSGEFLKKSLSILAPFGRFVEIGKRDLFEGGSLPLEYFSRSAGFFSVDLARFMLERPDEMSRMFKLLIDKWKCGELKPICENIVSAADITNAFRTMSKGQHRGKIAVSFEDSRASLISIARSPGKYFADPGGSYLIAGGLGGFGFSLAAWLVDKGAKHLVLCGRNSGLNADQAAELEKLKGRGVTVECVTCNISVEKEVQNLVNTFGRAYPKLRGVINAAMVLDDCFVGKLDEQRYWKAAAPKILGSWNLHRATIEKKLDLFLLCSSISSVLGSIGQANYASANSFLDALAENRAAAGLFALSVQLGPLSDVGYLSRERRVAKHLSTTLGVREMTSASALKAIELLLVKQVACAGVFDVQWNELKRIWGNGIPSTFSELCLEKDHSAPNVGALRETLADIAAEDRSEYLVEYVKKIVCSVAQVPLGKVESQTQIRDIGLDSLMVFELKSKIEDDLGSPLSVTKFVSARDCAAIAKVVEGHL